MIKSEVLSKDQKMNVSVAINGSKSEIYTEVKGILKCFNEEPELIPLIVKAMDELLKENKEDN